MIKNPTFNHTREDSPLYPCNICKENMKFQKLLLIFRTLVIILTVVLIIALFWNKYELF